MLIDKVSTTSKFFLLVLVGIINGLYSLNALGQVKPPPEKEPLIFTDASTFKVLGLLPGNPLYKRLPVQAEKEVRPAVWSLSKNTAGLAIRFSSNSSIIKVRWTLKNNRVKGNMTPIASNGLDLYAYTKDRWQFVGVAIPGKEEVNEATVIADMTKENREYLLNL
ncbi:SGNH/GDSL hydrolase N-terminal domain-containing protein, partial [uncultured Cyclobacterium sp.]|uniref:SGNH/GDSL hydrolase N-terminal domain-containing protein n=1 Tax=uncultured Cyclobacterium sp. TaxID=453820 RepID=UPI0030EF9E2E